MLGIFFVLIVVAAFLLGVRLGKEIYEHPRDENALRIEKIEKELNFIQMKEKSIGKYLKREFSDGFSVYGLGKYGNLLITAAMSENVKINYVIDKNYTAKEYKEITVLDREEIKNLADETIVVCSISHFLEIEKFIHTTNEKCDVISVYDLIFDMGRG